MARRRGFGRVRRLPSGNWQAFYADPEGRTELSQTGNVQPVRHAAPHTFKTKQDAEGWLTDEYRLISSGRWKTPEARRTEAAAASMQFGEYAEVWLANRQTKGRPLGARTREAYRQLLDAHILPAFAHVELRAIEPEHVDAWYFTLAPGRPTAQAKAYSLLRTILGTAVDRRLIVHANPARIRGAGRVERARMIVPATTSNSPSWSSTFRTSTGSWCYSPLGANYGTASSSSCVVATLRRRTS